MREVELAMVTGAVTYQLFRLDVAAAGPMMLSKADATGAS